MYFILFLRIISNYRFRNNHDIGVKAYFVNYYLKCTISMIQFNILLTQNNIDTLPISYQYNT